MSVGLAACSGSTSPGPGEGPPARLELANAGAVSGFAGNVVATPGVRVRNADGQVIPGVTVRFRTEGGGELARAEAISDGDGVASPGGWRLGATPGTQRLVAEVDGLSASHAVSVSSPPAPAFRIEVIYDGTGQPLPAEREAVEAAVHRWEELVIGDLPDARIRETPTQCPALLLFQDRNVDDLLLFVSLGAVANGVIASTDICIRRGNGLPAVATIRVNPTAAAASSGLLRAMEHEIAHALGIGTTWPSALLRERSGDLRFMGRSAEAAFQLAFGAGAGPAGQGVPVEMGGGPAVARSHWRESVLDRELLTPFSNSSLSSAVDQPLSAITVSALRDLGYVVNDARADPFTVAGTTARVRLGRP